MTSRQIDRPIRPLFPEGFRNETQVIALVFSADRENDPDIIGINAAGAALALSDIPFGATDRRGAVGQINGEFVVNPTYAERKESKVNITVVGTKDGIVMIESGASEPRKRRWWTRSIRPCGSEEDRGGDRRPGIARGQDEARGEGLRSSTIPTSRR